MRGSLAVVILPFDELDEGELGSVVDHDEEIELAFRRAHLSQVSMEEPAG